MSQHATLDFLNARRDWVLDAPKDHAPILTLCVRPAEGERTFVSQLELDTKLGVVGDRWSRKTWLHTAEGNPDPRIQVCLLGSRVLQLIRRDPDAMTYPGDNIIADMDFSEANLPVGQRLQVGSAVLEVSDVFNTACSKWQERHGKESIRWINLPENKPHRFRGILCQVVQGGVAKLCDTIRKL